MPGFFPFLTLLAFKMFTTENVDVAILEVGLGGRYCATNIVQSPTVCGITSLGFDHMEVLGNTLAEIASEKAGIFKAGVPAFSAPQEPEAMEVLHEQARRLSVSFCVSPSLDSFSPHPIKLGLEGDHQRLNAALAVSLCTSWEKTYGSNERLMMLKKAHLPHAYLQGLVTTSWPGRAQIIHDVPFKSTDLNDAAGSSSQKSGLVTFYLDGAHSPESMEACANWFCSAVTPEDAQVKKEINCNGHIENLVSHGMQCETKNDNSVEGLEEASQSQRVLLFNCMPKRDPQLLLPPLIKICDKRGLHINMALFAPPFSSTSSIDTRSLADICNSTMEVQSDLSWQQALQQTWESLQQGNLEDSRFAQGTKDMEHPAELAGLRQYMERNHRHLYHQCTLGPSSAVMPSLPTAINWLRCWASGNRVQLQYGILC